MLSVRTGKAIMEDEHRSRIAEEGILQIEKFISRGNMAASTFEPTAS